MAEANEVLTELRRRGVLFGLGGSVYDRNDPFGRLFLQTLAMVAEFEANLGQLRTREGMAKARSKGKLRGKQPKLPASAQRTIRRRYATGEVSLADYGGCLTDAESWLGEACPIGRPGRSSSAHRPMLYWPATSSRPIR